MVHVYGSFKKNPFESVLMRQMNPEPTAQCEVSQQEKDQYYILTHGSAIYNDGTDEPICRAAMEMQTQRKDLWPCPTLCNPVDCSTPGLPVHHRLPELTQIHVH